jgi:hypothetical protein
MNNEEKTTIETLERNIKEIKNIDEELFLNYIEGKCKGIIFCLSMLNIIDNMTFIKYSNTIKKSYDKRKLELRKNER